MNNSLETLKTELIAQKNAIISKGGSVVVAGTNPTPSEITTGINSIESPAYALSTAQPDDVIAGKTFFSGNSTLKTGTLNYSEDTMNTMFFFNNTTPVTQTRLSYTIKSGVTTLRQYAFYKNPNPVDLYLNSDLTSIGSYAFFQDSNFTFPNFTSLTNVTSIGASAFSQCANSGIDFSLLPSSLRVFEERAFQDCLSTGMSVHIPALTTMNQYCFFSSNIRIYAGSLTFDQNFAATTLPTSCFSYVVFNNDLVIPNSVRTVSNSFNYRGSFKSITIPSSCTKLNDRCFGASSSDLRTYFNLEWVEFKSETPPTIGVEVFAAQNFAADGAKIYVPDSAVETYKAVSNLSPYRNYILGISQKD